MDAATLVRVGEPFFTTKKAGAGTGLGVAMAKGFAEQSGGGIDFTSHLGRGTVVTLWLPTNAAGRPFLTTKAASRTAMQRHPAGADPLSPSVLLVDDEAAVRQMIAKLLTRSGMQVMVAGDGAEALAILDDGAHADALVTDLSMPGMDGIAVIRAAQERRPGLPAVLLTGYAGDGVALAVSGAIDGSYSLLRKPVTGAQLVDRVRALLAGRAGVER
jgi:CheY-like chemotaxis protein